jgi:glycosyltransferase involved in cell wall biosynthesis
VVVDHNDELFRRLRESLAEDIVLVENAESPGLSGARNTGIRTASGTIVAFLDDDACAEEHWAKYLLDAYTNASVFAVGGAVIADFARGRPEWFPPELDWVVGCTYAGHRAEPGPVRNLIGANMSFRADALARAGGFRSDLGRTGEGGGGCEETELCIRAGRLAAGTAWFEPRAIVHHFVPRERTTSRYLRRRCFEEGLSKSVVAALVGKDDGLSAERSYVFGALPRAAMREVRRAFTKADMAALQCLLALCIAPIAAGWGYLFATVGAQVRLRRR